jgi:single-strand DNA-binding protein
MNKIILIGNLTRDPELSTTQNGVAVCKFSLAVQRNRNKETDFFNITVWRTQAENCARWLKKGDKAAVVGSISIRNYDDQNGNKRSYVDVTAEEVQFLITNKNGDAAEQGTGRSMSDLDPVDDDDIPF